VKRAGQPGKPLSPSQYILELHAPEDYVAVLLVNRSRSQTLQRIASAETLAAPGFYRWLRDQNRSGSDIFVGMNPLKDGAPQAGQRTASEKSATCISIWT